MSLINKMLQDLDARGGQNANALPEQAKPVPLPERGVPARAIGISVAVLALVGAGAYGGWRYMHRTQPVSVPATPGAIFARAPASALPGGSAAPAPAAALAAGSTASPISAPSAAPMTAAAPVMPSTAAPRASTAGPNASAGQSMQELAATGTALVTPAAKPSARKQAAARKTAEKAAASRLAKRGKAAAADNAKSAAKAKRTAKAELAAQAAAKHAAKPGKAPGAPAAATAAASTGKQMTAQQQAESLYHRATAALDDGRISEAMAQLNDALKINPRHDAARQTLVGLLVEAHRPEEAMRHLQTGLTLEPRQPALAMLLARLQMERGADGIETLLRTLPYAAGNAEYHSFLAGALQHAGRHREAIEQYQAAVRAAPSNGVWWMGLGISLQAEKRVPEAADAFRRAKASGNLSAELQAFVDRKLQQLTR